jgi:hypothetical protein
MMNDALLLMAGVLRCAVGFDTYFCYGIIYRYGGIWHDIHTIRLLQEEKRGRHQKTLFRPTTDERTRWTNE